MRLAASLRALALVVAAVSAVAGLQAETPPRNEGEVPPCSEELFFVSASELGTDGNAEQRLDAGRTGAIRAHLVGSARLEPPATDRFGRVLPAVQTCLDAMSPPPEGKLERDYVSRFADGLESDEVVAVARVTGIEEGVSPLTSRAARRYQLQVEAVRSDFLELGEPLVLVGHGGYFQVDGSWLCGEFDPALPRPKVGDRLLVTATLQIGCEPALSLFWQAVPMSAIEDPATASLREGALVEVVDRNSAVSQWLQECGHPAD